MSVVMGPLGRVFEKRGAVTHLVDAGLSALPRRVELMPTSEAVLDDPEALCIVDGSFHLDLLARHRSNVIVHAVDPKAKLPDDLSSNVILVPKDVELSWVVSTARDHLEAMARLTSLSPVILSLVTESAGLDQILDMVARVMESPVAVMSVDGSPVGASAQVDTSDALWDTLVYDKASIDNLPHVKALHDVFGNQAMFDAMTEPMIYEVEPYKRRIVSGIWKDGACKHSLVVLENEREFRDSDLMLAEYFSAMLGPLLKGDDMGGDGAYDVFMEVVSSKTITPEMLNKLPQLGIPLSGEKLCAVLEPLSGTVPFLRMMGEVRLLEGKLCEAKAFFAPGQRIAVIFRPQDVTALKRATEEMSDSYASAWRCAISYPFESLSDIGLAYEQAIDTLLWAGRTNAGNLVTYGEAMPSLLLEKPRDQAELLSFVHPCARHMVLHDRLHDTEFAWTVYTYLRTFKSMALTAEVLSVHRNTVSYRLAKAAELFSLDYEDIPAMRCLLLSLYIINGIETIPRQLAFT